MNLERMTSDKKEIAKMSEIATAIIRDYYNPIIGKEQNEYMIKMFQTEEAILEQLEHGYNYYFVREDGRDLGFIAFYPRENALYLSKLYLFKEERGKGFAKPILEFLKEKAKEYG